MAELKHLPNNCPHCNELLDINTATCQACHKPIINETVKVIGFAVPAKRREPSSEDIELPNRQT